MSAFAACTARMTGAKSVVVGGYFPSYAMVRPAACAFARAPSDAVLANSASAARIATVLGLGFCAIASSKKPFEKAGGPSGPSGTGGEKGGWLSKHFVSPDPGQQDVL